jgi:hypothetical protein
MASAALQAFMVPALAINPDVFAHLHKDNTASIRRFENAGSSRVFMYGLVRSYSCPSADITEVKTAA